MARFDLAFSKLKLDKRTCLSDRYVSMLHEAKSGFEDTCHVFWSGPVNQWGYPAHDVDGKKFSLNGYLLYKNDHFSLAGDECIRTMCGIHNCCQTAHYRVLPKAAMGKRYSDTKLILKQLAEGKFK